MVLKMHIMEMNELKLLSNELSGRGERIWHSQGKVTARNFVVWLTWEPGTD